MTIIIHLIARGKFFKDDFKLKNLKSEDNFIKGMQAMAFVPVLNGKVATSEIVIAYAGTNPNDPLDKRGVLKSIDYVDG